MKDFKIGTRLAVGFAVVIAIALAFGTFAYTRAANVDQTADQLGKVTIPSVYLSDDMKSNIQAQFAVLQEYLTTSDRVQLARLDNAIEADRTQDADLLLKYESLPLGEKQRSLIESLKADRTAYTTVFDSILNLSRTGIDEERRQALDINYKRLQPAYARYSSDIDTLVSSSRSAAEEAHQGLNSSLSSTSTGILICLAAAVVFSVLTSLLIIRSITKPLAEALQVLDQVSKGELATRAEVASNDELGMVLTAINRMLDNQWNAAGVAERLAEGDLTVHVTSLPERDVLGRALVRMRGNLQASTDAAERIAAGDLSVQPRLLSERDQLGQALTRMRDTLRTSLEAAEKLAEGDLSVKVTPSSERDVLAQSLIRVRDKMQSTIDLAAKIGDGDLSSDAVASANNNDMVGHSMLRLRALLDSAACVVEKVSEGDLTVEAKASSENDVLGKALIRMVENLRHVAQQVISTTANLTQASNEMISSVESLSRDSNEHTAAVAETTSMMNGVAVSLQQNADHSQQTDKIASLAEADGKLSSDAINQTVLLMREVAEKTNALDEIARRNDLLTLAASVEAARAGEHGVGFAVVASELRRLGERTQSAAAEMVRLTTGGLKTAETAGEFIAKLVPGIGRTAELVREIAAASAEQNSSATQVTVAVQELDKVILQNASVSLQMASRLDELASHAQSLQTAAGFFKLNHEELAVRTKGAGS